MNKLTITFLFVFIFSNSLIAQLVVGENASVTVAESASITVAGLEINPNSDMVISGPNSVDRNLTSVSIDGAESMLDIILFLIIYQVIQVRLYTITQMRI